MKTLVAALAVSIGVAGLGLQPALAQHEGHAAHAGTAPEQLGTVKFANSCNAAVQPEFGRGMALLHSFWANDAIKAFGAVAEQDPGCAIAYWGMAVAHQQNPLTGQPPPPKGAEQALAALDKAAAAGAKTQRERDYIAAIDLIYRNADKTDSRSRRLAYEKAMEVLAQRYPDDNEARIFHALALQMTALLTDKTYSNQLKSAAILEEIAKTEPEHPGVVHYLVHA